MNVLAAVGDQMPEDVGKAGPIGLTLIVILLIAVVLLVRSMSKHLKRVPRSFDPEDRLPEVPDTPAELFGEGPFGEPPVVRRPEPGQEILDALRRAPRAIEGPRGNGRDGGRPEA